jgi:cysteine desulfurase
MLQAVITTFGFEAENAVEQARKQVAALIGADHREIVFTSGATESDNLAVKGVAAMYREKGNHIITCVTEHKAILDSCKHLEKEGYKVTFLPVDDKGLVSLEDLQAAITDKTILITIMTANNEVGVIQDIQAIGKIARERGVLFHTDAVQAVGKVPFNVNDMNVDLASLSAHKMYGPKGVGALYVRRRNPRVLLTPIIDGGGHERGMRSGTLNVPGHCGTLARHPRLRKKIWTRKWRRCSASVKNFAAHSSESWMRSISMATSRRDSPAI